MTLAEDTAKIAQFEAEFQSPSIAHMWAMDPYEFEQFIRYVFICAGYRAEYVGDMRYPKGPGVDLELFTTQAGQKPTARVEGKRIDPNGGPLDFHDVMAFNGVLGINSPAHGYFVTTGRFTPQAQSGAAQTAKVRLLDGDGLLRYIAYIRGSRVPDTEGNLRTSVPTAPDWLALPSAHYLCDPRETTVLALANNKGGVAKTTSALNLGFALAQDGCRVLLVDLDGQASLTAALPLPDPNSKPLKNAPIVDRVHDISEFFAGQIAHLSAIIQSTRFDNLWLLPASGQLHHMDTGGTAHTEAELAFVRAVHSPTFGVPSPLPHPGRFDWIILDTPPAQSFYTRVALAASHYALIPVNVEAFAIRGIKRVLSTARTMNALSGGAKVMGCVVTRWKPSGTANKEYAKLVNELAAEHLHLFTNEIPLEDNIEKAHLTTMGGGIKSLLGVGTSKAAARYRDVLDELIKEARPYVHERSQ
jgi:chromosome partitioning protein